MAKLATAREGRMYGPRQIRNRWEYVNAGIYVFATILLIAGFAAQFSSGHLDINKLGLIVILVGIVLVVIVNVHDLVAHMAGIDYCVSLVQYDFQLGLVEFTVPLVNILGSMLVFLGILYLLLQIGKGYRYGLERSALNLLIVGPLFWLIGSVLNLCQFYERADGHVQIMQNSVQIPFLMGSMLFFVGGILNRNEIFGSIHHEYFKILGKSWIWMSIFGSLLFLAGGMLNVAKVLKMQQTDDDGPMRLEKLRGGALEKSIRERVPLMPPEEPRLHPAPIAAAGTPYKDVLVTSTTTTSSTH